MGLPCLCAGSALRPLISRVVQLQFSIAYQHSDPISGIGHLPPLLPFDIRSLQGLPIISSSLLLTYLRDVLDLAQLSEARHASLLSFSSLQLILAAYALWWLWRFKIVPLIHPSEPKQYPYWIPCESRSPSRPSLALIDTALVLGMA